MRHENDIVVEFTGELFDSGICLILDELPSPFALSVASTDDIGSHLRNVGGVLSKSCLDGGDAPAHRFEQGHALVVDVLICLAIASVVRVCSAAKSASSITRIWPYGVPRQ